MHTLRACPRTGLGRSLSLGLLRQKATRRARWEKKLYAPMDEAALASCLDLARTFSLNAAFVASEEDEADKADGTASLEQQLQTLTRHYGERPLVLAVTAWPRKKTTLSARQIQRLVRQRPVVLLAGSQGYLPKSVLSLCEGFVRPVHCLQHTGSLEAHTQLVLLLDRILGDLC